MNKPMMPHMRNLDLMLPLKDVVDHTNTIATGYASIR
jgi:hypothetical protein